VVAWIGYNIERSYHGLIWHIVPTSAQTWLRICGPNFDPGTQDCYWLATMFSYLPPVVWRFKLDFSYCHQVSGNDFMYSYISIYSSLSGAISNLNYKYVEDHVSHTWYTVSMGNWLLTFQGNTDISSSVVYLDVLTTGDETTALSTWLWKPENLHMSMHHWMRVWSFDVRGSVHCSTTHKENPTRWDNVSNSLIIWSSTCFGCHTTHHQSCTGSLWFLIIPW
jgi:hypothetical protein